MITKKPRRKAKFPACPQSFAKPPRTALAFKSSIPISRDEGNRPADERPHRQRLKIRMLAEATVGVRNRPADREAAAGLGPAATRRRLRTSMFAPSVRFLRSHQTTASLRAKNASA